MSHLPPVQYSQSPSVPYAEVQMFDNEPKASIKPSKGYRGVIPLDGPVSKYDPVSISMLFMRFATIRPGGGSMQGFLRTYGFLGGIAERFYVPERGLVNDGERLYKWYRCSAIFRKTVRLYRAAQAQDYRKVRRLFYIDGNLGSVFVTKRDFGDVVHEVPGLAIAFETKHSVCIEKLPIPIAHTQYDETYSRWGSKCNRENEMDILCLNAILYVQQVINSNLTGMTDVVIERDDKYMPVQVTKPRNLLGVMWLQFAHYFVTFDSWKKCAYRNCGRWFEITPKQRRQTAEYCSDKCRKAAHYYKNKPHAGEGS